MKKPLTFLITIILFITAIVGLIFVYQITAKANFQGQKVFVIKKGQTVGQISEHLKNENFIKSTLFFKIYLYLTRQQSSVQAGTYVLEANNANIINLTKIFTAGKVENEIALTFIEGWTIKDIANYLAKEKIIKEPTEFIEVAKTNNYQSKYNFLDKIKSSSLEGFLFPDTYRIYKDATASEIITKMLDNFEKKITPALLTEITAQGKSLYEVLIMASIIEREVNKEEDRKLVSGILWRRLQANMPLQVDSSLKYIIGGKNPALSSEELKIDSPYNTYKYKGLPPTPISNPGESAIRAALYPKNSDHWYYLSAPDGTTIFSRTLEEHNEAARKYLKNNQ